MIDKVGSLIFSWNIIHLSQQHKLVLINSGVISMLAHILNCFKIPLGVTNKIDVVITRFLWAKQGASGMRWVRKKIIHLPRGMGGMGISKVSSFNEGFLMKQAWRLYKNPQLLLSSIFRAKGLSSLISGRREVVRGKISWGFRGILKVEQVLLQGCSWNISSGTKVTDGNDKWVQGRISVFSSLVKLNDAKHWVVFEFIQPDNI